MPDAAINSVQFIYTTLPAGSNVSNDNTGTITISSVTTDQAMIIAQCRNPNNSRRGVASFELTSSTEITYHRYDDRSAIEVNLYVIEWDSNVSVQHGHESTLAGDGTGLNDITITSVDTTKSLVFHSVCSAGSSGRNRNNLTAAYLTSGTNLRFDRNYLSGTDAVHVGWQVVEFPSGTVQSGTTTVTSTDLTSDVTITAVSDTSNTFVHHSLTSDNADNKETDGYPDVSLTSTTNLRVERWLADEDITVAYQVAEIPNWTVQRVENTFSGAGNIENQTITSVDTDNAFSMGYRSSFGGQSQSGTDQSSLGGSSNNANRTMHCLNEITSATNLEFYRAVSTFNASFVAYVIDVAAASGSTVTASYAEGVDFGDTYTTTATYAAAYNDGISLADAYVRTAILQAAFSDGISASDDPAKTLTMQSALAEGAQLGDLVDAIVGLIKAIQEGIDIGDSFTATAALQAAIADGLNLGDTATATALYNALVAEGVDFSDTVTGEVIAAGVISGALVDALVFADAMTVTAVLQAVYGEGFDIGDTFTASVAGTITGALSDGLVMSDSMAAALQLVASLSEGITFADVFTATVQAGVITGSLSEGVIFSSSFIANTILRGTVSEGMDFSDTVTFPSLGRYLVATISLYAALSAASTTVSPGLNASSINIKPD